MNLTEKLASERRLRLAAEHRLALKSRELFEANKKLSEHALALSNQIVEQREVVQTVRSEAEQLKDENQRTQAQLLQAEEIAQMAERRLWDSVETIADGLAVFDSQDRLVAANSAWHGIFDDSPAVEIGVPLVDILTFAAQEGIVDIGDANPSDWVSFMLDRWDQPQVPETMLRLWNGHYYRLAEHRSRDGDMVCVATDITALKQREEELSEARKTAETANRAKSAFLANMSHELRTPMNGVVGVAELMLEGALDDEQRLYAETICKSGEALLAIINDVLDFSKIEADKLTLHPAPFDLEHMLHEIIMLVQPTARDKSLNLHVDYDTFMPTHLVGDGNRIRQVITNLVGNAIKFTPAGHVLIRVVGILENDKCWKVHVTVEDTGIGIEAEQQQRIFGSFAQVEDQQNRQFEGTGLGLSISRELIDLMGGKMWVESEKDKGSCFGFAISLPADEEPVEAPLLLERGISRALIVGGGELDNRILGKQIGQMGLDVSLAESGSDALAQFSRGHDPHVVLIDLRLPDTDGEELAKVLLRQNPAVTIVLIGHDLHVARTVPDTPGIHAVLPRPVLRSELYETFETIPDPSTAQGRTTWADSADKASTAEDASGDQDGGEAGPRPMRVLAAEDNKTNQLVFSKMLKSLQLDLKMVADGEEAVAFYESFEPDIVFMDISMPRMDGKEATRKIREIEAREGRKVPIIAMTAHALKGDATEILSCGLDHYLTKPLKKEGIIRQIVDACPAECMPPQPPPPEPLTDLAG